MKLKYCIYLLVVLCVPLAAFQSRATVEWDIQRTLKLDVPPLDVAVSPSGKRIYILTDQGTILVYTPAGSLMEKIPIGKHVDQINVGPQEDILLLQSRQNKTVQILTVDFIKKINTTGSPFKGPADAPVVIAVFSEFQ
jgi:hypothetical protein